MPDVETSIRITAETKAALQNLAALDTKMGESARAVLAASNNAGAGFTRMDNAMGLLAKRSTPALGAAFGTLSSQAISMTTGFSGASGMLGMLGQSMMMASPIIGGVAIAAAALTAIMVKKKDAVVAATEAWIPNLSVLKELVEAHDSLSLAAGRDLEIELQRKKAKLETLELQLRALEATPVRMSALELEAREIGLLYDAERAQQVIARESLETTRERAIEVNELRKAILDLRKEIEAGTATPLGPPTPTTGPLVASGAAAEALRVEAQELALVNGERQRRNQMDLEYTQTMRTLSQEQGAAYVAMQELAIGGAALVDKTEKAKQKAFLTTAKMVLQNTAATAAQMLILQKANLGETIRTIIAEQEARLAALAIVALVEGLYYSITNPAAAASKFAAAAMAGAGAAALGVIGSAFEQEQKAAEAQGLAGAGATGTSETSSTGRTLVSQGPVTLYYNATLVVNGSILDRGDFFALWNEANLQNLRMAGVDAGQRARA